MWEIMIICDVTAVLRVTDGYVSTTQAGYSLYFTFAGVELAIRTTQPTGTVLENNKHHTPLYRYQFSQFYSIPQKSGLHGDVII